MNSKMFAITLGLVSFTTFGLSAMNGHSASSNVSRSHSNEECEVVLPFFTGKDTNPFSLNTGSPTSLFKLIPFSQDVHVEGRGIKVISSSQIRLKKGFYSVSYSGSSRVSSGEVTFFEYAVYLGNTQKFVFTDSSEEGFDNINLSSFTITVHVTHEDVLSIQARSISQDAVTQINNRSLVIIKLSE